MDLDHPVMWLVSGKKRADKRRRKAGHQGRHARARARPRTIRAMAHRTTSRLLLLLGAVLVLLWWVRPPSDPAGEWQAGLCHEPGERCQRIEQAELPDHGHAPVSLPHARSADQDGPMRYRMVLQVTEGMSGPRRDVGLCLPRSALVERVEVDGRAVALRIVSRDNKDRWIATLDFETKYGHLGVNRCPGCREATFAVESRSAERSSASRAVQSSALLHVIRLVRIASPVPD